MQVLETVVLYLLFVLVFNLFAWVSMKVTGASYESSSIGILVATLAWIYASGDVL